MSDVLVEQIRAHLVKLREPFPADRVGKLPRGGVDLDYVGHGAVTDRLLDVDLLWNWEPVATDEHGRPLFDTTDKGEPVGLWIRLTVCGVTRLGFGSCRPGQFDAEKVLIGDALRNAAMRFGVALDLWIRGHAEDDEQQAASDSRQRPTRGAPASSGRKSGGASCVVCGRSLAGEEKPHRSGAGWSHQACVAPAPEGEEEPF